MQKFILVVSLVMATHLGLAQAAGDPEKGEQRAAVCFGCHGVLRKGAAGKSLTTDITCKRGTATIRSTTFTEV